MPAPASDRIPGQARPVSRESAVESLGVGWRVQVRPFRNKARTMLAWLEIERPSGEITTGHKVMIGPSGKLWVAGPSYQQINPDGTPRVVDGKIAWTPIQRFRSPAIRDRFQQHVLAALRRDHPELFGEGPR